MTNYLLQITLKSDTTFGSGEGVAGLLDTEVEYDPETGLPYVRGRTLRGLLVEECANVLYALQRSGSPHYRQAEVSAGRLFGRPGSRNEAAGSLFVGNATLPQDLQQAVGYAVENGEVTAYEVLVAMTTLRRQTAIHPEFGAPEKNTLRAERAVLRETVLAAPLTLSQQPEGMDESLLAACALCLRRGGQGRNRGRGRLEVKLLRDRISILPDALLAEGNA